MLNRHIQIYPPQTHVQTCPSLQEKTCAYFLCVVDLRTNLTTVFVGTKWHTQIESQGQVEETETLTDAGRKTDILGPFIPPLPRHFCSLRPL